MGKFFTNLIRFQLIFLFLFFLGTVLADSIMIQFTGYNLKGNADQIFYWFYPKFSIIQTGNLILLLGGIFSFLSGIFVPKIKTMNIKSEILNTSIFLIILNLECIIVSVITTYFYEKIFIPPLKIQYDFNIIHHSIQMFLALLLFLSFWSIFGYGLKLTFSFKIPAIIIGLVLQIGEYIYGVRHFPSLEKYLPLGLSRQLVINQFPFWKAGSWADIPGVVPFASTPMLLDENNNFIFVSYWWIGTFMIWYLSLAFIVPIFKMNFYKGQVKHKNIGG